MNKITELLLFLLPLTIPLARLKYTAAAVCTAATSSAIHEGVCVIKDRRSKAWIEKI